MSGPAARRDRGIRSGRAKAPPRAGTGRDGTGGGGRGCAPPELHMKSFVCPVTSSEVRRLAVDSEGPARGAGAARGENASKATVEGGGGGRRWGRDRAVARAPAGGTPWRNCEPAGSGARRRGGSSRRPPGAARWLIVLSSWRRSPKSRRSGVSKPARGSGFLGARRALRVRRVRSGAGVWGGSTECRRARVLTGAEARPDRYPR